MGGSPSAKGRQGAKTDIDVVSASDFAAAIRELDGDCESKNLLVYGDAGCGKTVLAGSAPNSLILGCEPGYISAARVRDAFGNRPGKRKVRPIPDSATLLAGLDWLEAGGHKKFEWLVFDGSTTMETKARLGYTAEAFDNNPQSRAGRGLSDKPDYFNAQNFMKGVITRLVDLPVNVLITAHAMRTDDDAGDRLVLPAYQGKGTEQSNFVSGMMHSVGFMRPRMVKKKGKKDKVQVRRILWQQKVDPESGTIYFAKDQFNAFGRYTDDIDIPGLMALIADSEEQE